MSRPQPFAPRAGRDRAPLGHAQAAIWRAEQVRPGTALHNETAAFHVTGPLDPGALERALADLAARHEVMRCSVVADADGEPWQHFADRVGSTVVLEDLRALPAEDREGHLAERVARAASVPFDLSRPPLLRTHLFRVGDERHLLMFVAHHIVVDAWAFGVFLEALADRYAVAAGETAGAEGAAAEGRGRADGTSGPRIDFGDYAAWQRTAGQAEDGTDYWRERLGGDLPVLQLPTDLPHPDRSDLSGTVHRATLPAELVSRLSALGRSETATLPTVLLTAFCAVLQRFSGQDDLVVGMPVATRNLPRLSSVIGPLLNVMAHRADLSGEPSFREALRRTRLALKADLAHRDTPFDTVVTELGRPAGPGRTPLFQVMYAFHSGPATTLRLPGLETVPALSHSGTAKYDLSLFLRPRPCGELELDVEYRTGLFGSDTAASLADALLCLVRAAADEPDLAVGDLPVMTADQRRRVLTGFNAVDDSVAPWGSAEEAVRRSAAEHGSAPAVRQGAEVLGYAEVDAYADRVAAGLGAVAGERIAVRVGRSPRLVPLLLGIWRAGAAFVPVDEHLPAGRVAHVLRDSGAVLLVTDGPAAPASDIASVSPEELLRRGDTAGSLAAAPPGASPDGIAYLMYTSGSTGTPKGVAVPHRAVANLLHSITREPGIGPDDVLLAVTSLSFDISVLELFAPLTVGAQVAVAARETVRDTDALAALLRAESATVMQATPSLWTALVSGGWTGLPGLRAWSGGEPLTQDLAEQLLKLTAQVWNLYGPTETTIWSTVARVLPGEPVTVGRPVARTVCYVLDGRGCPVPLGATGELVIGGAGVSAGYWRRPELTAEAFVPDPIDPEGGTVYRTGDLARYLPDGRIHVTGRADQQVKLMGHRIELGETEHFLGTHPAVAQAVVVLDRAHSAGPRLVAFWTAAGPGAVPADADGGAATAALRRHLAARLPAAAVPSVFVRLPELPLNTSGKADRPALTRAARGITAHDAGRAVPATPVEARVAAVWADVLGLPVGSVGLDDDFLAAGGNSISATRLLARLAGDLGPAPALAAFYEAPVLRTLASHWAGAPVRPLPAAAAAPAAPAAPVVPLTDQQRQLWLLHRLDEDGAAYNLAARLALPGAPDEDALAGALADLVARHEVLAARCELHPDGAVMVYEPATPVPLDVVDLRVCGKETGPALDALAEAEAVRPFDLAAGPLLRATLVHTAEDAATLLVTAHHIAVDGWSIGVAVRDLAAFYSARVHGTAGPAPLASGFRAYAAEQASDAARAVRAEHLGYWTQRLAGHSGVLELPADLGRPAGRASEGATLPFQVEPESAARLRETAKALRTTPFTVLLTVFASLLGRYADTDDVVVGVPVAGRGAAGLDEQVGCFTNTLPVRIDLSGSPSFAELVARTGRVLAADLDRPLVPFDRLVSALELTRDPSRPPLVQAMLVFQNTPQAQPGPGASLGTPVPTSTRTAKYELTLSLTDGPDALEGELEYANTRFSSGQAARFAGHLTAVLRAALADPGRAPDALDLSDAAAAPAEDTGTGRAGHAVPVHELFRRRAAAAPDAPAVRHGAQEVRYGQLDRWSDAIAQRLLPLGAGPGRFVAVLLPTGAVQSAAILGVAKTGAAFACLDGSDPSLRLTTVLTDAEPVCVLAAEAAVVDHPGLLDRTQGTFGGFPLVFLDPAAPAGAQAEPVVDAPTAPAGEPGPDDPLCLVYTSGSTGTPKGIALPQATLAQFADWQRTRFAVRPGSRIAQWAPFTYDAAYTEVFAALCSGAVLCVPPDGVRRDPVAMAQWLRAERITQIQLVPAFFQLVSEALDAAGQDLPDLEHLLMAGEVLPVALAHDWAHRAVRPRIHNLYGPTECVLATHRELLPGEEFPTSVPVGEPIPGRSAVVLDSKGRVCPVGVTGEIHLRSEFLAGSYHRRPEESRAAYVPDPREPGATLYRTGDLGRLLPEGGLAFAGRLGSQVKIRGNRVELEEIEAVLEAHPGVREAAASVHRIHGAQRLTAYAVAADGVGAAELRRHLAERLPAAAVPETVLLLEALPRTRTNKRDRARLPLPEAPGPATDRAQAAAPLAGLEQTVADAWRDLLGTERIGRHTSFFEAGGDSLLAARLQIDLTRRLERPVRLVDIFARPTIAEFAAGLAGPADAAPHAGQDADAAQRRGLQRRAAQAGRARARRAARETG